MNTSLWPRRILAAAALASLVAARAYVVAGSDEPQATTSKQTPPKKTPYAKLAQPWPSAEVLKTRHASSDALP